MNPRRDGKDGEPGAMGLKGDRGERGERGLQGIPGQIGKTGEAGLPGERGEKGEPGLSVKGDAGDRGERGEKGDRGERGEAGLSIKGERGERGERGLQGEIGKMGMRGEAGVPGLRGESGPAGERGLTGALPRVKVWEPGVHYTNDVATADGATYQALRDTAEQPGVGKDWVCIARAGLDGHSLDVRGLFNEAETYKALDIVALNGGSFIARRDSPGPCPGTGWQLIASQGKSGPKGERGLQGPAAVEAGI